MQKEETEEIKAINNLKMLLCSICFMGLKAFVV